MAKKKSQRKQITHGKKAFHKSKQNPKNRKFDGKESRKPRYDDQGSGDGSKSKNGVNKRTNPRNKFHKKSKPDEEESDFEEVTQNTKTRGDGFAAEESDSDSELQKDTRKLIQQQNRKKKKSGGFQSMGLSPPVFKGIIRKGYKIPTPIQRKTVPLIMDGKDVVAMARTGSGKTAAFLVPMFERLKTHLTSGARALILAPTRELALQTLKFTKELGRFTRLKSAVILGGDSMEEQFAAIHENPDIMIVTPGRFMHVILEMELKLTSVEYVVFDEADRLFELGFQEQLREILQRLPETRQTLLFSATLPKLLVDFAKAGLHDPTLIRLDVDTKLSENLRTTYLHCRSDDKLAVLLHLLRNVVKQSEQTVIFVATKHHVEYLNMVLCEAGFTCSHSYSALDQTARKINVAKFRSRKSMILIVTDLAARGIDIPLLDNVINYNFPAKSKLFVHRVGRVARAGSCGTAYSLVAPDELPYVLDLHLFLGRPLQLAEVGRSYPDSDGMLGRVAQSVIDDEEELIRHWHSLHDVQSIEKVTTNANRHYLKSRPAASSESVKRTKALDSVKLAYHPMFGAVSMDVEEERAKLLESMRSFKPRGTIFEVNAHKKTEAFNIMKKKRVYHGTVIERNTANIQRKQQEEDSHTPTTHIEDSQQADIDNTFVRVVAPKAPKETNIVDKKKKRQFRRGRDEENYLNYRPKDFNTEEGLKMASSFETDATSATLDIMGDDATELRRQHRVVVWDRKRKKYVNEKGMEPGRKKVKTESGQWVSASYKKNVYKDWLERSKTVEQEDEVDEEDETSQGHRGRGHRGHQNSTGMEVRGTRGRGKGDRKFAPPAMEKRHLGNNKREIRRKEQIVKERRKKNKQQASMKHRQHMKNKRKSAH